MNAPQRPHAASAALFSSMKNVEINGGVLRGGARVESALKNCTFKRSEVALLKPSLADYASTLSWWKYKSMMLQYVLFLFFLFKASLENENTYVLPYKAFGSWKYRGWKYRLISAEWMTELFQDSLIRVMRHIPCHTEASTHAQTHAADTHARA